MNAEASWVGFRQRSPNWQKSSGVQQSATQKFLQNRCLPATRSQGVLQADGDPCSEAGPQDSRAKVKQFVSNTKFSEVFSL